MPVLSLYRCTHPVNGCNGSPTCGPLCALGQAPLSPGLAQDWFPVEPEGRETHNQWRPACQEEGPPWQEESFSSPAWLLSRRMVSCYELCLNPAKDFRFSSSTGLFPSVFNLASHATIQANATCGQNRQEVQAQVKKNIFNWSGVLHPH